MPDTTPRLALPLLAAGQAHKETFHNEALVLLDALALATVEAVGGDAPPADAAPGRCWIVGTTPAGAWAGQARAIAISTEGGWRFVAPGAGTTVRRAGDGVEVRYDGTGWIVGETVAQRLSIGGRQVVGAQQPGVAAPTGGTTVDRESREAIAALIVALSSHGLIAR